MKEDVFVERESTVVSPIDVKEFSLDEFGRFDVTDELWLADIAGADNSHCGDIGCGNIGCQG